MKVNFNLKQKRQEQCLTQLMVSLTVQKERIRVYTKIRIRPNEWDNEKRRCLLASHIPIRRMRELQLFNEKIEHIEECIFRIDYERAAKGFCLTRDDVRAAVRESQKCKGTDFSPLTYMFMLVDSYPNDINHRGLKGSKGSQTTYRVALQRLANFCREKKFRLTSFNDFDRMFFSEFTHYLYHHRFERGGKTAHYSAITVANTLKVIKNLLHRAYDNDISENLYYNKVQTHVHCSLSEKIYLTEKEIEQIRNVQTNDKGEQRVRDMFVIACYTALRISDLNQLGNAVIGDGAITLYQMKTRERVQIPILKEISELVETYRKRGFPVLSESKANPVIKELCRRSGLTQEVSCRENRGGVVRTYRECKYNLVSFHTARRSCITNLFKRGYPVNYIMTLSGHRSLQALQRYIRASREDMEEAFLNLLKEKNDI